MPFSLGDWPQLGGSTHRNNAPEGKKIPVQWDVKTGRNVKWSARLGSQTHGNVVVANGKIYEETCNPELWLNFKTPSSQGIRY